jgi:hypothetical protein
MGQRRVVVGKRERLGGADGQRRGPGRFGGTVRRTRGSAPAGQAQAREARVRLGSVRGRVAAGWSGTKMQGGVLYFDQGAPVLGVVRPRRDASDPGRFGVLVLAPRVLGLRPGAAEEDSRWAWDR